MHEDRLRRHMKLRRNYEQRDYTPAMQHILNLLHEEDEEAEAVTGKPDNHQITQPNEETHKEGEKQEVARSMCVL